MTPLYRVIEEIGPDHEKEFTLGVYVGDKLMGSGTGPSKAVRPATCRRGRAGRLRRAAETGADRRVNIDHFALIVDH